MAVRFMLRKAWRAQMAHAPDISGVAWSADESSYRPTLFVQGSPVRQAPFGSANRCDG